MGASASSRSMTTATIGSFQKKVTDSRSYVTLVGRLEARVGHELTKARFGVPVPWRDAHAATVPANALRVPATNNSAPKQ